MRFISSVSYSAAKGGVIALTHQIAINFTGNNIHANTVSPGFTNTKMLQQDTRDGTESYATQRTLMSRVGRFKAVANGVVFLISEAPSFVTGHNLVVDGGYSVQ